MLTNHKFYRETSLFLAEQLVSLTSKEQEEWLERITTHVQNQGLKTAKVEITHLELAIKECDRRGLDDLETIFSVISAYDVPKFKFNFDRKKFDLENSSSSLLPNATKKSVFLTNRYNYHYTIIHISLQFTYNNMTTVSIQYSNTDTPYYTNEQFAMNFFRQLLLAQRAR